MKTTHTLYLIFLTTAAVLANATKNEDIDRRIIGGRDAHHGEFPFVVSLNDRRTGRHFCGGVIIDEEHVITAAHCLFKRYRALIRVVAGTTRLSDVNQVQRCVKNCFIHENYHTSVYNDIGLIRVNKKFPLDGKQLAAATLQDNLPSANSPVVAVGWGLTNVIPPEYPDYLQVVEIPYIPTDICAGMVKNKVSKEYQVVPGMICAGPINVGQEACRGDSGGPLLLKGQVVGLVSWGSEDCSTYRFPGIYTDITYYRGWITESLTRSGGVRRIWTHSSATIFKCVICLVLGYY